MKPTPQNSRKLNLATWVAAIVFVTSIHAGAAPITGDTVTGNLTVTGTTGNGNVTAIGWGLFKDGIDIGANGEVLLNWAPGPGTDGTVMFDITRSDGTYLWRDSMSTTATNKMKLDANNVLSLFNSSGTAEKITLNGNNGQINLTGIGSGIFSNGTAVFYVNSYGNPVFGNLVAASLTLNDPSSLLHGSGENGYDSIAMSQGEASGDYSTAMSGGDAYGEHSTAMSAGYAHGEHSTAMSGGGAYGGRSAAMSHGIAFGESSAAMSFGEAYGNYSTALSGGYTSGNSSTAMSYGFASGDSSTAMSSGSAVGHGSTAFSAGSAAGYYSTAMSGGSASGSYSLAAGLYANASSYSSSAFGRYNTTWGSASEWVETDPLLLVGNGSGEVELNSNAITTLKNGQTTLTNKAWKTGPSFEASAENSNGEALVVEGHAVLKGDLNLLGAVAVEGQTLPDWLSSAGFVKQSDVEVMGYQTSEQVSANGYQTAPQVDSAITSKGYQTASQVAANGYQTASQVDTAITAKGYQTAADVSAELASRNLVTVSNIATTLANTPQIELGNTVLSGTVTISQAQGDIPMFGN